MEEKFILTPADSYDTIQQISKILMAIVKERGKVEVTISVRRVDECEKDT